MIRRQNRDAAVVLSPKEYKWLSGINIEEFEKFCDRIGQRAQKDGLTEEELKDIIS